MEIFFFFFFHLPKTIYTNKVFICLSILSDFPALFWASHPEARCFLMKTYILKRWFTDISLALDRDQCIENVIHASIQAVDEFLQHQLKIQLVHHRNEVTCCVFNCFR